jgi:hypothetical protein
MGHKGVSKRKPKQAHENSTPEAGTNSGRGASKDAVQAEAQPPQATGKSKTSPGSGSKPSAANDKNGKKR